MNEKELKEKYPYVVEVEDYEFYNNKTGEYEYGVPVYISKREVMFPHWEDAVDFYDRGTIARAICSGDNFNEDENTISFWVDDEGGQTYYTLHKWEGFEECRRVLYIIEKNGVKEEVHSYNELVKKTKELGGEKAYVYWDDGTGGRFGDIVIRDGEMSIKRIASVESKTRWYMTDYWREKEKLEKEKAKRERERKEEAPKVVKKRPSPVDDAEEDDMTELPF